MSSRAETRVRTFIDAHTSRTFRSGSIALTHDGKANPHTLTVDDLQGLLGVIAAVREIHNDWGDTDGDSLDQLALWEDIAFALNGRQP